ncbi:MAG: 16S rRNA (guanine(966)-N(2))-methyltransferase RsmD [Candidatus Izimaplasma sp.]|nr:16S rRNA (guanine(966)-N(2))-methyltransferase RsmD [Candidatus Izimaplasma bacterium]
MRVIAGFHRSRLLEEVAGKQTREIKDRVKEAIFNSIGPYFTNEVVLDLFAGSGSLGIESLSRGANKAVFVDNNYAAIKTIKRNIATLRIEDETDVINSGYLDYLYKTEEKFDIIFLDPPYEVEEVDNIISIISERKILKDNGIIVCLYEKKNTIKSTNSGIIEYKQKRIGITKVSFMKWGI